jgi:ubiquinone/menaquinone biosynthesis C-methylase UbiE
MSQGTDNSNTPNLWDKRLFETDKELLGSPFYLDKISRIGKFLKNKKGKFLDVGLGMANLERWLLDRESQLKIYGVDFSPKAVLYAKKKLAGKFVVAKSQKLPFKKSYFDFAAMLDVLEHIPRGESKKALGEINRVLKKGGEFVVSVPLNEDLETMNRNRTNFNRHLRQYTVRILVRELQLAGFKVLKRDFIYAFRNFYFLKNLITKIFPNFRKPNLLILYVQKK